MPNRIIKESIRTSRAVNNINDFQFRLWLYLITYVDDYGRGSADPEILHGLLFPRRRSVTDNQISSALDALEAAGLIIRYTDEDEVYLYFPKWENHQRIQTKKSKFPEPPPFTVSHGESPWNTVSHGESPPESNPIQYESNKNPKRDAKANFIPPTIDQVIEYAEQRNSSVDPHRFFDYFEAGGWKDAKGNPVKNWKQKFITWESKENGTAKRAPEEPVKHDWDDINFYDN